MASVFSSHDKFQLWPLVPESRILETRFDILTSFGSDAPQVAMRGKPDSNPGPSLNIWCRQQLATTSTPLRLL